MPPADRTHDASAAELLHGLHAGGRAGVLHHVRTREARPGDWAAMPGWVAPPLTAALAARGIEQVWSHQAHVAELARQGHHVVVATGTASGKSLCFWLPALTAVIEGQHAPTGRGATALYLAPTKALGHDQEAALRGLGIAGLRTAVVDGDTEPEQRRWARDHAAYVLTNPDLLHHSLLPGHELWASYLRALRYVIVDECHVYRGVFGAHVSLVLRRLLRIARRYRATPTVILASATVADPGVHAERLLGQPVEVVDRDGSPRGRLTIGLWSSRGMSMVPDSAAMLAACVASGRQTLAFARSRRFAELIARAAETRLDSVGRVAAYRGGFLPEERRDLEAWLRGGELAGLATTNALELGVDIHGLDAVVLAGWPGSVASFWQQAGRAGRRGADALAVLIADDDPLESHIVQHPEDVLDRPLEAAVLDPDNPAVLSGHLACAAAELPPLTDADHEWFGPRTVPVADRLVATGVLRRRPTGYHWPSTDRAGDEVSLRGSGATVRIVVHQTGTVIGTADAVRADATLHSGAVYLHQGQTYVVTSLDLDQGEAVVTPGDPGWVTRAQSSGSFDILEGLEVRRGRGVTAVLADVLVRTQVTGFARVDPDGRVLGLHALDLPERTLETTGLCLLIEPDLVTESLNRGGVGTGVRAAKAALHGIEHVLGAMLPLVATADTWDVGTAWTLHHPQAARPTILVHDRYPGGAGFARQAFERLDRWLGAALAVITWCSCEVGCPRCVHSTRCHTGNGGIRRDASVAVLTGVVDAFTTA